MYTTAKRNHESPSIKTEPELLIKAEGQEEALQELVFVSPFTTIQDPVDTTFDTYLDNDEVLSDLKDEDLPVNPYSVDDIEFDLISNGKRSRKLQSKKTEAEFRFRKRKASAATSQSTSSVIKEEKSKLYTPRVTQSGIEADKLVKDFFDISCHICDDEKFDTIALLQGHFREQHPDQQGYVMCCDRKFSIRLQAVEHVNVHHLIKFKKCSECDQLFKSKMELYRHMCNDHSSNVCWVCEQGFKFKAALERHVKHCELTGNIFQCFKCKKDDFATFLKLKAHMRHHELTDKERKAGVSYVCDICSWSSISRKRFNVHKHWHEEQKVVEETGGFKCPLCEKFLKGKNNLKMHIKRMHEDNRQPEVCNICGKRVLQLKSHMVTHNEEKMQCGQCGVMCKNKNALNSHLYDHKLEKSKKCQFCEKTFRKNIQLKEHEARHRVR